jgi:hypothetical protein
MADSDDTRTATYNLLDTLDATCKLDRIIAAVNLAHDVVGAESGTNEKLSSAWLTLELVQEKLNEMRGEFEDAPRAWTDSELASLSPEFRKQVTPRLTRRLRSLEPAHG